MFLSHKSNPQFKVMVFQFTFENNYYIIQDKEIYLFAISSIYFANYYMKNIDWDRDATSTAFDLTTFKKQNEAFKYADRVNIARSARNELPMLVFSREISNEGHRYFIVDDVDSFYEKYIRMGARDRTFYEVM